MKKTFITFLLALTVTLFGFAGLMACDSPSQPSGPHKLNAPIVTLNKDVASWSADTNADKFEISLDGNLSYVENTITSKTLTDGQTLKVRAVGNGINYSTSDWSNTVTYTINSSIPTKAPTYLGIIASNEQPSRNNIPSGLIMSAFALYNNRISLEEALKNYLLDSNNSLDETLPSVSDYEIFSTIGSTIYVQIWLNNPDQNTILSLKLNGTKYQTGGALQSFFIQDGNSYLNCVYVAVTIPANTYGEIAYEVTEIEYVEGTNISQDGKAVLIDQDNDTVLIGLPYEQVLPTATISNGTSTSTSISFDVNVTDQDGFVNLVGGWLRVIIFNQNNQILSQQKLTDGNNSITFNNLSADTNYSVTVIVLGDVHDGKGVYAHRVSSEYYRTAGVITCQLQSEVLLNAQTEKYYPVISVDAQLGDSSFSFTKIEVCDWDGKVYYTGDFDGSLDVTENILNGREYVVKVYYQNSLGVEQAYTDYVSVDSLDHPWVLEPCLQYGLLDDVILGFDFGDNKSNFDNLTIKIFYEDSKQYIAEDAISLIDNPNLIDELNEQLRTMDRAEDGYFELGLRINKLEQVQQTIERYYSSLTKTDWQTEKAKGIYTYEYVYGQDEEFFKGANNKYYIVLDDYQLKRVNDSSWQYILTADFDMNNGEDIEENRTIDDGWFDVKPALTKNDYLIIASDDDYNELFTLDENNVLYLELMSRNNLGNETYLNLGYVNQIVFADGYDILQVLWTQEEPNHDIDENAWLMAVKNALINGEDVKSVFPLGQLQPITFDLDDIEIDPNLIGNIDIRFTYKMYGKEYTTEHPYDWDGATIEYTIKGALPQVTIEFTGNGEDFGRWSITSPDWIKNGIWNFSYSIEVRDANQQLVGTYTQDNYGEYERLPINYSIRVRLESFVGGDYYTQGEWSDWFTCTAIKLSTPNTFTQSYDIDGIKVEWNWIDGAEKYVYVINDGTETETSETWVSGLKNGDRIKVKAIPSTDRNYAQSDYSEVYTINDNRTQLAMPTNIRIENKMLMWDAVDGAVYYEIEFIVSGTPHTAQVDYPEYFAIVGYTYRIRACSDDVENYLASEWSESFIYTVTLENPTFSEIRRERVYWNYVENAGGYNYKIGENGQVNSTRNRYVALSDIPAGEKLYVQAYAEGCESTDWVMIYHNVN